MNALCADCGASYPFGVDTVLPDDQWRMIEPSGEGLLCGACIAWRVGRLPEVIAIRATIEFQKEDIPDGEQVCK